MNVLFVPDATTADDLQGQLDPLTRQVFLNSTQLDLYFMSVDNILKPVMLKPNYILLYFFSPRLLSFFISNKKKVLIFNFCNLSLLNWVLVLKLCRMEILKFQTIPLENVIVEILRATGEQMDQKFFWFSESFIILTFSFS